MKWKLREPVNGLTHLAGSLLSLVGLVVLVGDAAERGSARHMVSFAVFGASLVLLYTASALYHLLSPPVARLQLLKRVDHMMIFVLIAGTYTPICLIALRGAWGWSLLAVAWGIAIAGIAMKALWLHAPRWLSTSIYLGMGWVVVVAAVPLVRALPAGALSWLAAGGLLYTVGAVIYGTRRPDFVPGRFGFHELFHLFVLAGSFSHYWLMLRYVARLG